MGGFCTTRYMDKAHQVIFDRSFWNLSNVAAVKTNPIIGNIFNMFINNNYDYKEAFEHNRRVVIVYDPLDRIIPLPSSMFTGVFYYLA